jgi:hypothetical protein
MPNYDRNDTPKAQKEDNSQGPRLPADACPY